MKLQHRCSECGQPITGRRDRQTCSPKCRVARSRRLSVNDWNLIEAERPPASEGSWIHPICDDCYDAIPQDDPRYSARSSRRSEDCKGSTCCYCQHYEGRGIDSRGYYVTDDPVALHGDVWIH